MAELPTYTEVAAEAGISHWTVRRYAGRGVFETYTDSRGVVRCEADAAEKAAAYYREHGGPGGRPVKVPGDGG